MTGKRSLGEQVKRSRGFRLGEQVKRSRGRRQTDMVLEYNIIVLILLVVDELTLGGRVAGAQSVSDELRINVPLCHVDKKA